MYINCTRLKTITVNFENAKKERDKEGRNFRNVSVVKLFVDDQSLTTSSNLRQFKATYNATS